MTTYLAVIKKRSNETNEHKILKALLNSRLEEWFGASHRGNIARDINVSNTEEK